MANDIMREAILNGKTVLGIELGSTRIKSALLNEKHDILASGIYDWENKLENGIWTYHLEDVWTGLQTCYQELRNNVKKEYGVELEYIGAIGISGMRHGFLAFDSQKRLLAPFRTWRNVMTEQASAELVTLFEHQIPQRWSIAHLYKSILDDESYIKDICYMTTLSGYVHWMLTGELVLGSNDASGMFPIDSKTKKYYAEMLEKFDAHIADRGYPWKIEKILPKPLVAGDMAGVLSETGAKLLDISGNLKAGIPMSPPEGDSGTGMVATNSIKVRSGNVSAGTSIFYNIVLEKRLSKVYKDIDIGTTPEGNTVALVHANNGTSDLNAWVGLFKEFCDTFGIEKSMSELYDGLYQKAMEGEKDCGGVLAYNYVSGEHSTDFEEGRPLVVRKPDAIFNLANFMRAHLMTSFGAIKLGNDLLMREEQVKVDAVFGHGGLFKTEGAAQKLLASALNVPVSFMKTAGEGGAWGGAVLAAYMLWKEKGETLSEYLDQKVFVKSEFVTVHPDFEDVAGFQKFMERYTNGLAIERAAVDNLR